MKERGTVSLWIGRARSAKALAAAVDSRYTADGDEILGPFATGFAIGHHDEDFREAERLDSSPASLLEALEGASYLDVIGPRLVALPGAEWKRDDDCIVLLYDFGYSGQVRVWRGAGVELRFIGCARYL